MGSGRSSGRAVRAEEFDVEEWGRCRGGCWEKGEVVETA